MNEKIRMAVIIIFGIYLVICTVLYFIQESLLFFPEKLTANHQFQFYEAFEEVNIETEKGIVLNNIHFTLDSSKGVVLFFHGNGGAINSWGFEASLFLENGYEVFFTDYRSYGKSNGKINNELQLVRDGQAVYDYLKTKYNEQQIIVSGTSIGTGIATQIAAANNPKQLILNAPYYSLISLIKEKVFFIPSFIIKYKLKTFKYIKNVKCPITIFHGQKDQLIPVNHALKLKKDYSLIDLKVIENGEHNNLSNHSEYIQHLNLLFSKL